jgi:hypothetical protein
VDLPVLELNLLNFHLFSSFFFDFPPAKRALSTRSSESPEIYPIYILKKFKNNKRAYFWRKKRYESVNFRLQRARPDIRRPWLDMQPFPHIHAPLKPTNPLVVTIQIIS